MDLVGTNSEALDFQEPPRALTSNVAGAAPAAGGEGGACFYLDSCRRPNISGAIQDPCSRYSIRGAA